MHKKTFTAVLGLTLFVSLNVFAASKRYIVVYKSNVGLQAMDNYMKKESSHALGKAKTLKNIKMMVLSPSNQAVVESFKKHPEVAAVVEEFVFPAPKPMSKTALKVSKAQSNQLNATVVGADPMTFQQGTKTPWGIMAVHAPAAWTASGAGSEAHVLVVDTGIDINHEALAGRFVKAKNFVPEMFFGFPVGDADETQFQDEVGHGTHVSGTVGAMYNDKTGFVGVAPKAKMSMGKVCAPDGCPSASIIEAINWGVQEKVDVITMSLGGAWPECTATYDECYAYYTKKGLPAQEADARAQRDVGMYESIKLEQTALDAAEQAGVMTIAASGNSGLDDGASPEIGYPARHSSTLAVGAVDVNLQRALFSQYGPQLAVVAPGVDVVSSIPMGSGLESSVKINMGGVETEVKSASFAGTKSIDTPASASLMDAGFGAPSDFAGKNFQGKFALISRGGTGADGKPLTFVVKLQNAMKAKAAGAIIYNNAAGIAPGTVGEDEIDFPMVIIEQATGQQIVAQLTAGQNVSATLQTLKTDYSAFQGTSMATPHVAGVAALVISTYKLSHNGQAPTPAMVRDLITKTAHPLAPNDLNQYGKGMVQADAAVTAAQQ